MIIMLTRHKGYKYRLKPTAEQTEYLNKAFGCARKMHNLYVDILCEQLQEQGFTGGRIKNIKLPTPATIKKDYPYMKEIDSLVFANTQLNFQKSIQKYNTEHDGKTYKKTAKKKEQTIGKILTFKDLKGFPSYKSKKKGDYSFTTNNQDGTISIIDDKYVRIPKLKSLIKFVNHRQLPKDSIIKSATISKDTRGKYYITFLCEYYILEPTDILINLDNAVGLDYAQHAFYVDSEGTKANYPHYYRTLEAKLKKEQQKLSRKKLYSNNWYKQKEKISKLQAKIARQRLDWLHKKSYEIVNRYDVVVIEDLDLRNLAQCLKLGKNLHDNGFGIFRTLLAYKLEDRNKVMVKIDRWFPSSKICHSCGYKNTELKLSYRVWQCSCGLRIDRDTNAAINISEEGKRVYSEGLVQAG